MRTIDELITHLGWYAPGSGCRNDWTDLNCWLLVENCLCCLRPDLQKQFRPDWGILTLRMRRPHSCSSRALAQSRHHYGETFGVGEGHPSVRNAQQRTVGERSVGQEQARTYSSEGSIALGTLTRYTLS